MAELWERQPGENPKPWEAFCIYRDLKKINDPRSKRSIRQVSEILRKSEGLLERWSSENNWVERVAAWDSEQDRIKRELAQKEMQEDIRRMLKRQAEAGKFAQVKAVKALNKMPEEDIKPSDAARLLDVGSKLERIARGYVDTIIEERQGESTGSPVMFYMPDNHRQTDDENEEENDD